MVESSDKFLLKKDNGKIVALDSNEVALTTDLEQVADGAIVTANNVGNLVRGNGIIVNLVHPGRYRHYFNLKINHQFLYVTIAFYLDLDIPDQLSSQGLLTWFQGSPFKTDTSGTIPVVFPASGIASLQNGVVYSIVGLFLEYSQEGIVITRNLKALCNYGNVFSVDATELVNAGVYDRQYKRWL